MWETLNRKLDEANEKRQKKLKYERRLTDMQARIREVQSQIPRLELKLEKENRDVEQLTKLTLTSLFHTILRSKEEQLELERQEALRAALQLQEAKDQLAQLEKERSEVGLALAEVRLAEQEYETLMREKESKLQQYSAETASQIARMDEEAAFTSERHVELREAVDAGELALNLLRQAEGSLGKAEDWGTWDMLGGGTVSTYIKHGHIDDARSIIRSAQLRMRQFEKELADVGRHSAMRIEISGSLEFADYFFDGLITDWIVQGRIQNSLEQVRKVRQNMARIVADLQRERATAEAELTKLRSRRTALIEGA
ncbi:MULTISPECIES: hypothetical protein [Paenibacillus]|uniref:Uncharacterized protein n=1 Tax=Paenibacillus oceani TaxID=2772510 RepID=A0A927CBR5_9BACL|nr:hypothetical protein [Paenibacillus oceani]MBD2863817.1 hypothetical protein [Paenibacillus oceani]